MKHKVRIGALAFCAIGLVTVGAHAQYVYTRGPNHVNMSGSRCRAAFAYDQEHLSQRDGDADRELLRRDARLR
ncbi:uncharacterized protein SOCE836_010200 [Sorangium cellulosum]|uniref:Secreted protein n=1 Tax=Sorangium cellulosum TaxID=56 RepID=A0A4P2QGL5_SORCE|nr:uncharacterized protein SOCE836_010200 [Sorangium cellulosum]WCQ88330.1 hypothetical protein NQZ70_01005 [Sorangium sp. Soce836]